MKGCLKREMATNRNKLRFETSNYQINLKRCTKMPDICHLDEVTGRRLIEFYRSVDCDKRDIDNEFDIWPKIVKEELGELERLLVAGQPDRLLEYLARFGESFTWFGGYSLGQDGYISPHDLHDDLTAYYDKLVALAEVMGLIRFESPEYGQWMENIKLSPDELLDQIRALVGFSLVPDKLSCFSCGLKTKFGPLHYRQINAFYAAYRASKVVSSSTPVFELGGGIGLTAYYANKLGKDNYVLVDMPYGCIFAANCLIGLLGEDAVTLENEKVTSKTRVRIITKQKFLEMKPETKSLVLNVDGFPEFNQRDINLYCEWIDENAVAFLSFNHESFPGKITSSKIKRNTLMESCYRFSHPLRQGYCEEFFVSNY